MSGDHYQRLGVARDATAKQVAKAFRAKARVLHPDKQPPGISDAERQRATAEFQELSKAYEVISDADKRAHYDFTLDSASFAAATAASPSADEPRSQPGAGSAAPSAGAGYAGGARGPDRTQAEWERERRRYGEGLGGSGASGAASSAPSRGPRRMRQEHEEEERRRLEEFEYRQKLGSHWVKPPPRGTPQQWDGWVQSGAGQTFGGAQAAADDSDDESSVLSFDIGGIDLRNLDLHDLEPMDAEDNMGEGLGGAEVWRIKPAEAAAGPGGSTKDPGPEAAKGKTGKGGKPCCTIQ